MRQIRIGIDVGGTFTDAVAIDNKTLELIAWEKIPTTHDSLNGVADGIINVLQNILQKNAILPEEVVFIAHSTTQATNALLEGDVAKVGIIAIGSKDEALSVRTMGNIDNIPLSSDKTLQTFFSFIEMQDAQNAAEKIDKAINTLSDSGAEVIVATEAYGVDDPNNEKFVIEAAHNKGLYATGGHEVSKLYGLKVRTRTAVVNACLIPRMIETADMTESCVKNSGINSPLMIMRCDGGVMTIDEMRRRPILTMMSGLAAGVAGALMYEKLSDGIFLESGGTSTDISVIRDGRVIIRYGQIGGHKTYISSLDVRTLGIAGGSMIRIKDNKIIDVGPRSAHIAGLPYEVFSDIPVSPQLELIAPLEDDEKEFAIIIGADGRKASLTLAGAANLLGCVPENDYAFCTDKKAVFTAWQALGDMIGCSAQDAARRAMDMAAGKIREVVSQLISDYDLSAEVLCLAGGGGSAGAIVPYLGEKMNIEWKIVRNAPIISTIGVAMAMIREVVERTVADPTDDDIKSIRREAMEQVMRNGASERTVEITVEIEKNANILRAIAIGTNEFQCGNLSAETLSENELSEIAIKSLGLSDECVSKVAAAGKWHIFEGIYEKKFLGLFPIRKRYIRVIDRNGVICLQRKSLGLALTTRGQFREDVRILFDETVSYDSAGEKLPDLFVYYGEKQLNLSGLTNQKQIISVLETELDMVADDEKLILLAVE
ncbi:MAG: hydantoinase/oxoprolinase family protein [Firmicutes bacterium]|nr:hydantoinase/oxoprolinase family protein [Bacillota bacterium]